jgi:DNA-3-methyladenine glycosylase II
LPEALSEVSLRQRAALLAGQEPVFAALLARLGPPPLWERPPGFATLVHIILEQQVSLASARAAFERLKAALPELSPAAFLTLDDARLLAIGFSRQKAGYCRELVRAVLEGRIDLDGLADLDDDTVRAALVSLKGIGPWTAEIYLLMVLLRPDAWPRGDLALASAARQAFALPAVPGYPALAEMAEAWRPHRAVAARLLWHLYLSR